MTPEDILTIAADCTVYPFGCPALDALHAEARLYGGGRYTADHWYVVCHHCNGPSGTFYTLNHIKYWQTSVAMYDLPPDWKPTPDALHATWRTTEPEPKSAPKPEPPRPVAAIDLAGPNRDYTAEVWVTPQGGDGPNYPNM